MYLWAVGVDRWLGKEALLGLPPPGGADTDHPNKKNDEDEEDNSSSDATSDVCEVTLDLCWGEDSQVRVLCARVNMYHKRV